MDSSPANKRFAEDIAVTFPLLSDWKRRVVKDYGLLDDKSDYLARATFVVNKEGIITSIEEGRTAVDPTGAYSACSVFEKKATTP